MNTQKIIFALSLFICFSCSKEETNTGAIEFSQRTVLVYMAADNNLYNNAKTDIREILKSTIPVGNNLLLYLDAPSWSADSIPQLYLIQEGRLTSVKQYRPHNSASPEVLNEVLKDAVLSFQAESYGLVLWSHGTGWLPEKGFDSIKSQRMASCDNPLIKSFGKEEMQEINIVDLAATLPVKFEYIIFDACLMSSIEVLYQLRNKAGIIIASPSETLVDGYPYDKILPFLFDITPRYAEIAQTYMNYYKNKTGILQSATIAVVATKYLESFAATVKKLAENGDIAVMSDIFNIQSYDMLDPSVFYDLQNCLEYFVANEQQLTVIKQQLSRIVLYHDYTPYFLLAYPIVKSCGISVYISSGDTMFDEQYKQLDWYQDVHLIFSH
ncbi:MAG: hypothetical protein LBR10_05930 [Prevotellaceae bacterium]|jgi:hypothetical protein|nr:hypothetical protein [Prevotellaceae bacterium]